MLFQIVHATGSTVYLLFFLLFLCASRVPRTNAGAGCWAVAVFAAFLARIAIWTLTSSSENNLAISVYTALIMTEKAFLLLGAASFFGRPLPRFWLMSWLIAATLWLLVFVTVGFTRWWFELGLSWLNVLPLLALVWLVQHSTLELPAWLRRCIDASALLTALHWTLFVPVYLWWWPWWQHNAFTLGTVLVMLLYLSLLAAVFAQFYRRLVNSENKALEMAYQDPLTGLNNKRYVDQLFEQALLLANRPHQLLALYYIDLDQFKPINDSAGHKAGDLVLKTVAQRLKSCLRSTDICARVGGDEFVVIATQLEQASHAEEIAAKLLQQLCVPIDIDGRQYALGASIGISLYPSHGQSLGDLLEKADQAMYQVKQSGKNSWQLSAS